MITVYVLSSFQYNPIEQISLHSIGHNDQSNKIGHTTSVG